MAPNVEEIMIGYGGDAEFYVRAISTSHCVDSTTLITVGLLKLILRLDGRSFPSMASHASEAVLASPETEATLPGTRWK
jgi:hypothetical protein